jgi:predicted nucleotidyltransferase component of viral defense system
MRDSPFYTQANLMVRMIPEVARERCFALKGGTAINFFWREMPRLSVDIDLVYLPVEGRETALEGISAALDRIVGLIEKHHSDLKVQRSLAHKSKRISKLVVSSKDARIKIEPNEVIRGSVYPPIERDLCGEAEELFEKSATISSLSFEDLYGGKLCAALDRQHPRDIFDMKLLLENEGITDPMRKAFIVYLLSHPRPINELLNPTRVNIEKSFNKEFLGMPLQKVTLEELVSVRERYISISCDSLTEAERRFLLTFKAGGQNWSALGLDGIERLPALQWKLKNILFLKDRNKKKHTELLNRLKQKLEL